MLTVQGRAGLQDCARQRETVQDIARQFKIVQDIVRQCRTMQDSAMQYRTVQNSCSQVQCQGARYIFKSLTQDGDGQNMMKISASCWLYLYYLLM